MENGILYSLVSAGRNADVDFLSWSASPLSYKLVTHCAVCVSVCLGVDEGETNRNRCTQRCTHRPILKNPDHRPKTTSPWSSLPVKIPPKITQKFEWKGIFTSRSCVSSGSLSLRPFLLSYTELSPGPNQLLSLCAASIYDPYYTPEISMVWVHQCCGLGQRADGVGWIWIKNGLMFICATNTTSFGRLIRSTQYNTIFVYSTMRPLPSHRQHPSYGDCLEVKGNIIRTALCWIVWHSVHSQQHTYMSSFYRFNRLGLSHWDPYAVHRGGCLELYYCNMVEWFWWDLSLISTTNWFPSVLWHSWFGHLACNNRPRNDL